ncbi:hypothetical protein C8Q80DRAFT_217627 [Daedaleopsis nitida]|nr:hypothetical protein C8Q80DRAFT_217627 [Daedaleopsis nitida]
MESCRTAVSPLNVIGVIFFAISAAMQHSQRRCSHQVMVSLLFSTRRRSSPLMLWVPLDTEHRLRLPRRANIVEHGLARAHSSSVLGDICLVTPSAVMRLTYVHSVAHCELWTFECPGDFPVSIWSVQLLLKNISHYVVDTPRLRIGGGFSPCIYSRVPSANRCTWEGSQTRPSSSRHSHNRCKQDLRTARATTLIFPPLCCCDPKVLTANRRSVRQKLCAVA